MMRLWQLCYVIMVMAMDCVHVTAEPTELENLRKRLDMVELRLASDILLLRRDLDTERRLRIELQNTVHQLQEQKFTNNHTHCPEDTDILKADLKAQQSIIEQLRKDVHNANYQIQTIRNHNARLQHENNDLRHNIIVLQKAFGEEKQWRKQTEKIVSDLRSKQEDLQLDLKTASDQVNELMLYKSSTEKSLTSLRSDLHHIERKQNELNSSASTARNQMDTYIDSVSNQVCQLNPSYVDACQSHGINKSGCCLRRAIESVHETLQVNGWKLLAFEKHVSLSASFIAHIFPKMKDIKNYGTILFDVVVHNEGSAYNPENGKFVAPISGTYVFFWNFVGGSRGLKTYLTRNGFPMLHPELKDLFPDSNMLVVRMYKGDYASMMLFDPYGVQTIYNNHQWSTFSGFLLHAS